MNTHLFRRIARALVLVAVVAGVLTLAAAGATWSGSPGAVATSRIGRSTVPHSQADLSITKAYRRVGRNEVIFTIVVKNNSAIAAKSAIMTDILSKRLAFEVARTNKGSCRGRPVVTCSLGNLPAGHTVTITIRARIKSLSDRSRIINTATVRSSSHDPQMRNNTASVQFKSR